MSREELMSRHGARAQINYNGERWADFCQVNELVIGRTLFPHDGGTENQIDHMALKGISF